MDDKPDSTPSGQDDKEPFKRLSSMQRRALMANRFATGLGIAGVAAGTYFVVNQSASGSAAQALIMAAAAISALALLAFKYLEPSVGPDVNKPRELSSLVEYIEERFDKLETERSSAPGLEFNEDDRKAVLENVRARMEGDAFRSYVENIRESITQQLELDTSYETFSEMYQRLGREVQDLAKRGNLNLVLGVLMTLVGLIVLGYSVAFSPSTHSPQELLTYFVPRVSLVLLIEVFAYFFLGLYKQSLAEIKYFQNEITNVQSRDLALHIAMRSGDNTLRARVVDELSKTERNFLINKDQTTVELERERIAKSTYLDVLGAVKDLVKSKG